MSPWCGRSGARITPGARKPRARCAAWAGGWAYPMLTFHRFDVALLVSQPCALCGSWSVTARPLGGTGVFPCPLVGPEAVPDLSAATGAAGVVAAQPTVVAATAAIWSGIGCALLHPTPPDLCPSCEHQCAARSGVVIPAATIAPLNAGSNASYRARLSAPPIALDSAPVSIYQRSTPHCAPGSIGEPSGHTPLG